MLSGGNDEGAFTLSSSGQLSLTETLDREVQEKYILLITATDSGMTALKAADSILKCLALFKQKIILCRLSRLMFQYSRINCLHLNSFHV